MTQVKLRIQIITVGRNAGCAVLASVHITARYHFTENHFGMIMKVGIIPYPFSALGFGRDPFGQIVSGEFDLFLTLFQEDNIRRDLGSGERLKRRVRQTDSADKLRAPCDILPYGFVVFIERPFRSDKGDDTADTQQVPYLA